MNQFEGVLEAARHQKTVNLNCADAFGVGVYVPVGAAEMPHRAALNVLHHPVEMARHAVPFVRHGKQRQQQVGNGGDCQRNEHRAEHEFEKWRKTRKPPPGIAPTLLNQLPGRKVIRSGCQRVGVQIPGLPSVARCLHRPGSQLNQLPQGPAQHRGRHKYGKRPGPDIGCQKQRRQHKAGKNYAARKQQKTNQQPFRQRPPGNMPGKVADVE